MMPRMLDLFCGRGGWTNAFLAKGWGCTGVDIVRHEEYSGEFMECDVLTLTPKFVREYDFVCASSPCEEFSVWGMANFHPNPKFPDMGLVLFCWTRRLLDIAGVPYVMENVRSAQKFVGKAMHAAGPFTLWGTAVPPLMPQGIIKGIRCGSGKAAKEAKAAGRITEYRKPYAEWNNRNKVAMAAKVATIPPELANCVADYAERLLEQRACK